MGYSLWGSKELDTTERLPLSSERKETRPGIVNCAVEAEHTGVRKLGGGGVLSKTSQGRKALGFCSGNEHPPTLAPFY